MSDRKEAKKEATNEEGGGGLLSAAADGVVEPDEEGHAQRRTEDLQDVPVSVSAIGEQQLEELNIDTFEDYLEQLPTVTAGGTASGCSSASTR